MKTSAEATLVWWTCSHFLHMLRRSHHLEAPGGITPVHGGGQLEFEPQLCYQSVDLADHL